MGVISKQVRSSGLVAIHVHMDIVTVAWERGGVVVWWVCMKYIR